MNGSTGDSGNRWSIIDELANLKENPNLKGSLLVDREPDLEDCLGRVLRPHDEAGFQSPDDDWMIRLRALLDDTLESLTMREIREQLAFPNDELPHQTQANLQILFRSDAFLRYVNAYLYFGIRFLASRMEVRSSSMSDKLVQCFDSNVRTFSLVPPPVLAKVPGAGQHFEQFALLAERQPGTAVNKALCFLDDFHQPQFGPVHYELNEPTQFELWLRGLHPETEEKQNQRFEEIKEGLIEWAQTRCDFYLSLAPQVPALIQPSEPNEENASFERPAQGWLITHPMAARLALADIYWISRLLRADVSANATVIYHKHNWLHLLRFHATLVGDLHSSRGLEKVEEALRSVFDYVCDLVQNSVEITREDDHSKADPEHLFKLPEATERWRATFDEELDEIARQRKVRHFRDPSLPPDATVEPQGVNRSPKISSDRKVVSSDRIGPAISLSGPPNAADKRWSKRVTTGEYPHALIGLAFSGGGIRSATFNLGLLQGLQELDILRRIDYLSTVSGGGFIGSWLVANVRRSVHWLGRLTDWSDSIAHLRAHSNYLAPRTGILSADTWSLANSWFRNAFLIQLTGLAWLFSLLLATLVALRVFLFAGQNTLFSYPLASYVIACTAIVLIAAISYNLYGTGVHAGGGKSRRSRWVRRLAVTPAWAGACALASQFWADSPSIAIFVIVLSGPAVTIHQ